jgi:hypothetical protein
MTGNNVRLFAQDKLNKLTILNTKPDDLPLFVDKNTEESAVADNKFNFNNDYDPPVK